MNAFVDCKTRRACCHGSCDSGHRGSKRPIRRAAAVLLGARSFVACAAAGAVLVGAANAADLPVKAPPQKPARAYDWTGFYVGGHLGYAWGTSNWATPGNSGSIDLSQPIDIFSEAGSFFTGLEGGYNFMLPNRMVLGGEADASFPSFQTRAGISIGGSTTFASPLFGPESYGETVLSSGTLRGRIGYAPGDWLLYATGGFAWSYDQLTLTQATTGTAAMPFLWRLGWAAGAGIEAPVAPHWTARLEYLLTDYRHGSVLFANTGQRFSSDFSLQSLRAGVDYHFGGDGAAGASRSEPNADVVNFHGQATVSEQAYPPIRSPYEGANSLPATGQGREVADATLYAGVRPWQGGEIWIAAEIDQGFGIANTHGIAGFSSGEAYKMGFAYPYARLQRAFLRQTIDLGGDVEKVDADISQFAGSRTANRLVLTLGRFAISDMFDTNKYANNPKTDFLNWTLINAGTFDYAGDGWGMTYGAAAEWYQGDWTARAGIFDLSATPAGGISPLGGQLDPTFQQFQMVGEIERRYQLGDQPGAIKITGFLSRGRAGHFADAVALAQLTGTAADITAVRVYDSRPGVSINLQQQIADDLGVFARAGWADGTVEPWDFTDVDGTVSAGASLTGKRWNRPDDTVGVAGVINGISKIHQDYFNAGGLGILIGDGMLPHPGLEQIIEAYYSYAVSSSVKLTADYQFIANPGYNTDRGPVNVFSGRVHWQF